MLIVNTAAEASRALEAGERAQARAIAGDTPWPADRDGRARREHPLGLQVLAVEREESKSDPARRIVRVFQYHYALRQARLLRVEIPSGTVLSTRRLERIHLPLSVAEENHARARLAASRTLLAQLQDEQRRRGQVPFTSLDQLQIKAIIHTPSRRDDHCQQHRCAALTLIDDTQTVFAITPLVDLQSGNVSILTQ